MPDALAAMPARRLRARPPLGTGFGSVSPRLVLVFGALVVFAFGWVGPDIATDGLVRGAAVPVRGGAITDGKCSINLYLDWCDATLSAPAGVGTVSRRVHYVFVSKLDKFYAEVVADPQHPQWLTTDLGLDYFWNRIASLTLLLAAVTALFLHEMKPVTRVSRLRRLWRDAAPVAVPLTLVSTKRVRGGVLWTVRAENGRTTEWNMPGRAAPFVLGPANRVLGLATEGAGRILPLDAKLRWVELSKDERAAVLAAGRAA